MSPGRRILQRKHLCRVRLSLLLLACSSAGSCSTTYTVRLTAAEVQQSLNRKLPISRSKLLVIATVQSLEVEFREGADRVRLRPQVALSFAGQGALTGQALVEGQIRYVPDTAEFYLDAPQVVEVTVEGIPEKMRPVAEEVIAKCIEVYLTAMPVYRLKQTDFKQSLARMFLKSVKVRDGQLQLVLGMP